MKISAKTIGILKNFSTINPSIVIKEGNVLSTMSTSKTIIAKATIDETFPRVVPIYQLNQFLGGLSLFETPEVEFEDKFLVISENLYQNRQVYGDVSLISSPPDKELKLPSIDVDVKLTNKDFSTVKRALANFGLPEIAIVGDGNNVSVETVDVKNEASSSFRVIVGETDKSFKAVFRAENMKMMDGDYNIQISSRLISKFVGVDVTYWIAVESSSVF